MTTTADTPRPASTSSPAYAVKSLTKTDAGTAGCDTVDDEWVDDTARVVRRPVDLRCACTGW